MSPETRIIRINDPQGEESFDVSTWPAEDVLLVMSAPIAAAASVATWISLGKPEGFIDLEALIPQHLTHTLNFPKPAQPTVKPIMISIEDDVFNQPFDEEEERAANKDFKSFLSKMLKELSALDDLDGADRRGNAGQRKMFFNQEEISKIFGINPPPKQDKQSPVKKVNEVNWKEILDRLDEDDYTEEYPEGFDEDDDSGRGH